MKHFSISVLAFCNCFFALGSGWSEVFNTGWTTRKPYPITGYSEFTPAYLQGVRPYEVTVSSLAEILSQDAFGEFYKKDQNETYFISQYEYHKHVRPGLEHFASHWLQDLEQLNRGDKAGGDTLRGIPAYVVRDSPFWPADIPKFKNKPIVSITPLQLSRIQEDLGRKHPWTIYGGADSNWEKLFWQHIASSPQTPRLLCRLLKEAFKVKLTDHCDLKASGVRIWVSDSNLVPQSLRSLILPKELKKESLKGLEYLLTYLPYGKDKSTPGWPAPLKDAYRAGTFQAIPHPSTLLFSSSPIFNEMTGNDSTNPAPHWVRQIPLAQEFSQFSASLARKSFYGLRLLDVVRRIHRYAKTEVPESAPGIGTHAVAAPTRIDDESDVPFNRIFNAIPSLMGLYEKPIARNAQLWGFSKDWKQGRSILDGATANLDTIRKAKAVIEGTLSDFHIHYRNYYPPMQINEHEIYWYLPLVAWSVPSENGEPSKVQIDAEWYGSVTAKRNQDEIWFSVDLLDRGLEKETLAVQKDAGEYPEATAMNIRKLVEFSRLVGARQITKDVSYALLNPLPESVKTFDDWKNSLARKVPGLEKYVSQAAQSEPLSSLTFVQTHTSEFEYDYWNKIFELSEGVFERQEREPILNKNNADCAQTDRREKDSHCKEHTRLEKVADYLRRYYESKEIGLPVYSHSFTWKTEFDIKWWGGLSDEQQNLIIPIAAKGENPKNEVIIIADHYDTAFQQDTYEGTSFKEKRETPNPLLVGHRHASKGADDNYSATATLMMAAKVLKNLTLNKDVWLVHLTGEEFPADGLGIRALCQALIEGKELVPGKKNVKISGVYVLDMVSHHTDRDSNPNAKAVFQISPGRGKRAAELALVAHRSTQSWNQQTATWNTNLERKNAWVRFKAPKNKSPEQWEKPTLGRFITFRDEIRPAWHFYSSFFNTDPQVLADYGFPVVLFMENYKISRRGYHDTLDDIENIDLDFGRGVAAIAIESVAQLAADRK